jgi:hypothetical protein
MKDQAASVAAKTVTVHGDISSGLSNFVADDVALTRYLIFVRAP